MSSVNIAELLDQMDEVIENATASMLSSKRYIDIPAMQELIAQARENLPTEIEQATQIVRDRSAILKDAKQEAHETQEAAIRNADNLRENARREAEALGVPVISETGAFGSGYDDGKSPPRFQGDDAKGAGCVG